MLFLSPGMPKCLYTIHLGSRYNPMCHRSPLTLKLLSCLQQGIVHNFGSAYQPLRTLLSDFYGRLSCRLCPGEIVIASTGYCLKTLSVQNIDCLWLPLRTSLKWCASSGSGQSGSWNINGSTVDHSVTHTVGSDTWFLSSLRSLLGLGRLVRTESGER